MKTSLILVFALTVAAGAQRVVVVDNEDVRIPKVTVGPVHKTAVHQHLQNRVMIYLNPGSQKTTYEDGREVVQSWKAGEPLWSPIAGNHVVEIMGGPITIVEVELRKPGGDGPSLTDLDPVKVDPKHYTVDFENDQVRVVRVRIGPNESTPMHEHVRKRVATFLTDQNFRAINAGGKTEAAVNEAGAVVWGEGPLRHREENLSDEPFEALMVELK
ncbi:MAG: hypothetical protein O2968_13290 [Acidobacteria bacterium]|nr:hypothetical protein [Acidobacteriota bacterium]